MEEHADGFGHANGSGNGTARFGFPLGIAVKGTTAYIADRNNQRIRAVAIGATSAATTVSDFAGGAASGDTDGARATARFTNPEGAAVGGNTLYVADTGNHLIRAVNLTSGAVSTIAGSKAAGSGNADNAAGTSAQFNSPTGLAVSGNTLYVADSGNHRIRAINLASGANHAVTTIAGSTAGNTDAAGTAAKFNKPYDIAVWGSTLYVVDAKNHRIRKVDLTSKAVTTIAGSTQGYKDGVGTAAQLDFSSNGFGGIVAVSDTRLFVADFANHRIRLLEYK